MTWTTAEEQLSKTLPGYESRENQTALAQTIEKGLADGAHLMAQAGTGTGKSLANLIPAIEFAVENDTTVIVSTATKALQAQYADKDIPFLQANLGIDFRWALLKGRSNYACKAKLAELGPDTVFNQRQLVEELDREDADGDIEALVTELDMRDRPKLVSSSDECPGKRDCPFGDVCFAERAKTKARDAQLVIVNHSMLVTDLMVRERTEGKASILPPEFGGVVIDEAHELEEYATSAMGTEFSQNSLTSIATQVTNFVGNPKAAQGLNGASVKLFTVLSNFLGKDSTKALDEGTILKHQEVLFAVQDELNAAASAVAEVAVHQDDQKLQRRKRLLKRLDSLTERFTRIMVATSSELVRWVEHDNKRGTILKFAPLHVGPFLRDNLWEGRAGVLLSATLAMGSDFSYIANRLGIDDYRSFDAGTPFNYPKQASLFVPEGFDPSPARAMEWRAKVGATLTQLAKASGGRALFLFTSTSAMKQAHQAVAPFLEEEGITVLMQGEQTNRALTETFKADETSVLFALKSFMTGFDVQGDALRLVVLDKLPFPVPTDVINKARTDAWDAKHDGWKDGSFMRMTVPGMSLTLSQAFGRLIRTRNDEGLVAILDSRLHSKPSYGKKIMAALPPARRTKDLREAVSYLEEITERRG